MKKTLIALACILASPVAAGAVDCLDGLSVGADALYWRASGYNNFAGNVQSVSGDAEINEQLYLNSHFDWGFRVWAGYTFCPCSYSLYADYTRFESSRSISFNLKSGQIYTYSRLPFNQTLNAAGDQVRAKDRQEFDRVNLALRTRLLQYSKWTLSGGIGLQWLHFHNKEIIRLVAAGTDAITQLQLKSQFGGFGPRFDLQLDYCIWNGLSAYAQGDIVPVIGYRSIESIRTRNTGVAPAVLSNHISKLKTVAVYRGAIGLAYWVNVCCGEVEVHAGYEVTAGKYSASFDSDNNSNLVQVGDPTVIGGWIFGASYRF